MKILKNGQVLADLDNIISAKTKRVINREYTLSLSAFEKRFKSEYFEEPCYIDAEGDYFDIVYVENSHVNGEISYNIECEHVSYRLLSKPYIGGYSYTGTPAQVLADLVSGTDLQAGFVDTGTSMTISTSEDTNAYAVLLSLAKELNWEIDYTGFYIHLKNEIGKNNGYEARFGTNLKSVKKIFDRRKGIVHYTVDVISLKNEADYKYGDLEVIEIGDTIKIVDEPMGLEVSQRIVSVARDLINRENISLEIANTITLIADAIVAMKDDIRQNKATIKIANGQIEMLATDVEGAKSSITQNANQIALNVTEISGAKSSITQNANQIALNVTEISGAKSSITQNANQIALKVDTNGIISAINLSPEAIQILSNKINLVGAVTVLSDITGQLGTITAGTINGVQINSANINISEVVKIGRALYLYDTTSSGHTDIVGEGSVNISTGNGLYADNEKVATEDWVQDQQFVVYGSGIENGGGTVKNFVEIDTDYVVCSETGTDRITIATTSNGIVIRENGTVLGSIIFD